MLRHDNQCLPQIQIQIHVTACDVNELPISAGEVGISDAETHVHVGNDVNSQARALRFASQASITKHSVLT